MILYRKDVADERTHAKVKSMGKQKRTRVKIKRIALRLRRTAGCALIEARDFEGIRAAGIARLAGRIFIGGETQKKRPVRSGSSVRRMPKEPCQP